MPVYIAAQALFDGFESVPYLWPLLKTLPWIGALLLLKLYFAGARNASERNMHGKVVIVTGGTSGIGEAFTRELAQRGAQIVLLTQHSLGDPFIVEYIDDLRRDTNNQLITAEQVDLASLHNIRTFATKWIDNAPPRRLDMVVLCANTQTTKTGKDGIRSTVEGVEVNWQVNYLANFHLLSILSPALRAQPPDRDVRILFGTCSSYLGGDLLHITQTSPSRTKSSKENTKPTSTSTRSPTHFSPGNAYATSKLALTTFALAFQKHLSSIKRPDNAPAYPRVLIVDPGLCRTPGTRRWLSFGTLFGLFLYLLSWPLWWLLLKSPEGGAQSFLYAAMEEKFSKAGVEGEAKVGGWFIKECKDRDFMREDVKDEEVQRKLWEYSEKMVEEAEKRGVVERARRKKEAEE
ncbi:hypothetical protein BAUCODRAFT_40307, partial [Baudoinia panamericana UAMH 10762]